MNGWYDRPILAIETSCDETSASIVWKSQILSNVVASQIEMHQKWGGVVPEAAARAHVESTLLVISQALERAGISLAEIEGFAATNRPGLVGALSVGVSAAKSLAFIRKKPWLGIHHLEGHIWSLLSVEPEIEPPFIALVVSGGHTELVLVHALGKYQILGQTLDDAAGEAFDKSARTLGLPYPGGKALAELASHGDPSRYLLPVAKVKGLDFSFSGLKTAVWQMAEREGELLDHASLAASAQAAIIAPLVSRSMLALDESDCELFTVCGGVSANVQLRTELQSACNRRNIRFIAPPMELCTDNAAMIGLVASLRFGRGESCNWEEDVSSNSQLPDA